MSMASPASTSAAPTGNFTASKEEWERWKPYLQKEYLGKGKDLKKVAEEMRKYHGSIASENMFKKKFRQWGFAKYKKEREMVTILQRKRAIEASGQRAVFRIRDREVPEAQIAAFAKRKAGAVRAESEWVQESNDGITCTLLPSPSSDSSNISEDKTGYLIYGANTKRRRDARHASRRFSDPPWQDAGTRRRLQQLGMFSSDASVPPDNRLMKHVGIPGPFRVPNLAFYSIQEHVAKSFQSMLPQDYVPWDPDCMDYPQKMIDQSRFRLPNPECVMTLINSVAFGINAVSSDDPIQRSRAGALFEKGFEQIGPVLKLNHVGSVIAILYTLVVAEVYNRPEIGRALLHQIYEMSQIYGRQSLHATWSYSLLSMPETAYAEMILRIAKVYQDAYYQALGPYHVIAMSARRNVLRLSSRLNSGTFLDQPKWEQLLETARLSPHGDDYLVRDITFRYADLLRICGGPGLFRVREMTKDFIEWLAAAAPSNGWGEIYSLVNGANAYADCLVSLGEYKKAEDTIRFILSRSIALFGPHDLQTLDQKQRLATFLRYHEREDEMEGIYAELIADLEDFTLEKRVTFGNVVKLEEMESVEGE